MSQEGALGLSSSPSVPTNFVTDSGTATPAANTLNVFGGTDITTSGAGNTVTITFTGSPGSLSTLTGNSGGAVSPTAANINTVGSGSITVIGSPGISTLTTQLTGLTNHNVLVGAGTATITNVSPSTAGFVLTSNGVGSDPSFQAISASGAISSITGNSGGAETPLAGNFLIVGTGSITTVGSPSTETVQLTGLTNHNVLVGAGTATITNVAPSATVSIPFVSNGAAADPSFGNTNRIGLYITGTPISSGSDSDGIFVDASFQPSANITNAASIGLYPTMAPPGGVTISNGYGLYIASGTFSGAGAVTTGYGLFVASPTIATTNITAQLDNIRLDSNIIQATNANGTLTVQSAGTGTLSIGTNATSHQTTVGSTTGTSATLVQSGSGGVTLNSVLMQSTSTINQIVYSSANNTYAGITAANQSVLTSTTTGVPTWVSMATDGKVLIGSTSGNPAAATLTAGTGITITNASNSITISASSSGFSWTDVTGATQTLAAENGYITDRGGGVTYTLPASGSLGDTIKIVGKAGLATITPNANQQILIGSASGSVGVTGTAVSNNAGDCIELVCITAGASTVWRAESVVGTWTLN